MTRRHAIVIAVDGLRASALGAYGSTTYPTPALDALAARSMVVDWMLCDGPGVADFYRAAWQGEQRPLLFDLMEQAGVDAALTTDDAAIAAQAERLPVSEVRRIDVVSDRPAESIADTALAQLFAIAIDQAAAWAHGVAAGSSERSKLLWLHARGFHAEWDAPRELREQLLAEDDVDAADFIAPPVGATVTDPDELLQYRSAYAAQTLVLDACVEALMSSLADAGLDEQTLVVLVGCRGFALGEHGLVGSGVQSLYGEVLHVPCLVWAPHCDSPPPRSSRLAQPSELYGLIRDWFGAGGDAQTAERSWMLATNAAAEPAPEYVIAHAADGELAVRTRAWMLRRPPGAAAEEAAELYAKPFDRWEANEVSGRRPEIVERMLAILDAASAGGAAGPLDADLVEPAG